MNQTQLFQTMDKSMYFRLHLFQCMVILEESEQGEYQQEMDETDH